MKKEIITISGDLGSGKTVVSRILSEMLRYEVFSTGSLQRQIASEKGMSTLEMNQFSEIHKEIDHMIDQRTKKYGETKQRFIFDSRMAWFFIDHSFKVYLFVDEETAALRIQKDGQRKSESYGSLEKAKEDIIARRDSEKRRFFNLYEVKLDLFENYDLVVDTSFSTPNQVAKVIFDCFEGVKKSSQKSLEKSSQKSLPLENSSCSFFTTNPVIDCIKNEPNILQNQDFFCHSGKSLFPRDASILQNIYRQLEQKPDKQDLKLQQLPA